MKPTWNVCNNRHLTSYSLTFLPNECEYETLRLLAQHQEDIEDIQDHWAILLHVERAESGSAVKLWQHPSGIYKVYYLLVDGIMCSITQSKDQIQKSIGECVMSILSFLVDIRGNSIISRWLTHFSVLLIYFF